MVFETEQGVPWEELEKAKGGNNVIIVSKIKLL